MGAGASTSSLPTDPNGIQPGFGFQPGQLIPPAPYIFPGEQDLFQLLELTAEYAGYFGYVGEIIAVIAEVILVILELIDELVSLFTGKPRAQDTLTVAKRLGRGQSPVAHLMSVQISRNLDQNNIVLSSSSAADQKVLGDIRKQAELMLEQMGTPAARAKLVVDEVWTQTQSATQKLPVELDQPIPNGLLMVGPQQVQLDYINHYNSRIKQGFDPLKAGQLATNWVLQNSKLGDLGKIVIRMKPLTILPGNPCLAGEHWDPVTMGCVPNTPPPPPPQPPPMQPCFPSDQGGQGDELTDGLNCVAENLGILAYYIPYILTALGGNTANSDPVTCTQLTTQVAQVTYELAQIAINIANSGTGTPAPIDLTPVVSAIGNLVLAVDAIPAASAALATALAAPLNSIAESISKGTGTDITPIVDQLKQMVSEGDVANSTFQWLQQQGFLTPEDLQLYQGLGWADSFFAMIRTFAYRAITNYLATFGISTGPGGVSIANPVQTIAKDVAVVFNGVLAAGDTAITPTVNSTIDVIRKMLTPPGATQIGVINVDPTAPVTAAISIALAAAGAAWLLSFAGIDEGESLTRIAEIVAGAVGFEELRDVVLGPLVRNGIGKIAEMQAKAIFKQEIPGTSALTGYVAMGLMNAQRAQAIAQFNGTPDELYPIMLAAAYRGLNARQMLRLIETGLFSDAEIADELTFSAMRPASQARMLRAAPYLATAPQRSTLLSAIEAAGAAGLYSDAELISQVDSAEQNDDRDSLILSRVHLLQLVAETKALEAEYTTLYKAGLMADAAFRANLEAIGLQPFMVTIVAAKAEAQANATLAKQTLAAERALERATEAKARTAAVNNFTAGNIDAAGLLAALLLTGLTAVQAAAWVDLAILRKAGGLRWIYGLQLTPSAATLLRQRVSALVDQRKRLQITDLQFVAQLQALGIGDRYVNAIQAATDALITPKTSAFAIPVKTN